MAFWPVFRRQRSLIDEILDKPEVNLEELLDQDDIIQECRYMNDGLLEYLASPDVVEKLIRYVIQKPPELKKGETDESGPSRYPFIASELFECGVGAMHNALFDKPELLGILFSILERPPPLEPSTVAYFRKVVNVLIQRKFEDLTDYMREEEKGRKVLGNLISHIGLHSILELLNLLTWDDMERVHTSDEHLDWLCEEKLISRLVDKLDPSYEEYPEIHANAAQALVDAALRAPDHVALRDAFSDKDMLKKLFSYLTSKSDSSTQHTLSVLIALVQRHIKRLHASNDSDEEYHDPEVKASGEEEEKERKKKKPEKKGKSDASSKLLPFADLLLEHLPHLLKLLKVEPEATLCTLGRTATRFGPTRLKIVELLLWLLRTLDVSMEKKITELKVLPVFFDLFEQHEWHNMLHIRVANAVETILDGQSLSIQKSLFVDAKILDKLASCYKRNDDLYARPKGTRVGYMGHVIHMSNSIIEWHKDLCAQTAESSVAPPHLLEGMRELRDIVTKQMESKDWQTLVEKKLAVDNERMQVVLGGHRPGDATQTQPPPQDEFEIPHDDLNLPDEEDDDGYSFENEGGLATLLLQQQQQQQLQQQQQQQQQQHQQQHQHQGDSDSDSDGDEPKPSESQGPTATSSSTSAPSAMEEDDLGLPTIDALDINP